MLGIKTPAQATQMLEERTKSRIESVDLVTENTPAASMLANRIEKSWQNAKSNKTIVEHEMLTCLRDRKGEYSPEEANLISQAGGSDIFVRSATGKIRAGIAHIKSILMPGSEKAYGITHTANPELPKFMTDAIIRRIQSNPNFVDENGQPMSPMDQAQMLEDRAKELLLRKAKMASRKHQNVLFDQLQQGGWHTALSDHIDDICTYPVAFMKGPFFLKKPILKWEHTEHGFIPVTRNEPVMSFRTMNPFDSYWAAGSDSVQRGDFIERLRLTSSELYDLIGSDGYNEEAIRNVLRDHGRDGLRDWLWTDAARMQIADHLQFWQRSTTEIDGLHWYGKAQGLELLEWGINPNDIDDPLKPYDVDAIMIGNHIIRAVINADPLYRRPVHSACYEKVPGNVAGNSPSMLMSSSSRMINATARALQNNLAHASGFQVEIDYTRLHEETDAFDIHPFKLWQARESEMSGDRPAVRFFQPKSNARELMEVISFFKNIADEDTGIPRFFQGTEGNGQGADATAKGRAMLADQSTKLLRSAIMNIDMGIIIPKLQMMYDHNMLTHPDDEIKGDSQVVARGANAMLMRDSSRQSHMAMLELTNNPEDRQLMGMEGRAKLLKAVFDSYPDIEDDVIPNEEGLERKIKAIENTPPPPDPALVKIESDAAIEQQKLQAEAQRSQLEIADKDKDRKHSRELEMMKMRSTQDNDSKRIQNQIQLDNAKLQVQAQADAAKLKVQAQADAAKLEAQKESEKAKIQAMIATKKIEAEIAAKSALEIAQISSPGEAISSEDIEKAVCDSLMGEIDTFKKDMMKVFDEITKNLKESATETSPGAGTFTFNISTDGSCEPVTKTFTATRDAKGNLQGTVTPSKGGKK